MAGTTNNFGLTLPVGDDLFNPLWSNSNTTKIDEQMKENQDNSITHADCVFNTDKYIITRTDTAGKYFKFIAPVDYVADYTFQVDGTDYNGIVAGTGDSLAAGCFKMNHEVIAYIDTTSTSLAFLVGTSLPEQLDAHTLDGHEASYFGTAEGVSSANDAAIAAGTVANQALEAANAAGMHFVKIGEYAGSSISTDTNIQLDITELAKAKLIGIKCLQDSDFHLYVNSTAGFSVNLKEVSETSTLGSFTISSRAFAITPSTGIMEVEANALSLTMKASGNSANTTDTTKCIPKEIYAIY